MQAISHLFIRKRERNGLGALPLAFSLRLKQLLATEFCLPSILGRYAEMGSYRLPTRIDAVLIGIFFDNPF